MRRLLLILLLLLPLSGCDEAVTIDWGVPAINGPVMPGRPIYDYPGYEAERPTVNLEEALREENWFGPQKEGSCVHATMIMLFRWQGHFTLADHWRETYCDGEWAENLAVKFDKEGVRYAFTVGKKDVSFLEWACSTRRGCGVTVKGGVHMVMLVHLDHEWACILDNNFPDAFKWVPRETFLSEWYNSNSWAVTPIMGPPPPPLPFDSEEDES